MKDGVCPKCRGTNVLANLSLIDRAANGRPLFGITVGVQKSPGALVFKDLVESPIRAWVCEGCGLTEFYVTDPGALGRAIDSVKPGHSSALGKLPYRVPKKTT